MKRILLNCDMGESFGVWNMGDDAHAMPLIDQANLACGFHASDPMTMLRTVELAVQHGVSIGAHPAYPDMVGFGRRHMACSPYEVTALVLYQVGALDAFCRAAGTRYRRGLPLMTLALTDNARELHLADEADVPLLFEAFADRAYLADGQLAPRRLSGAVHRDPQRILEQGLAIARGEPFADIDGKPLQLRADSLCVHGDNADSLAVLRRLRAMLDAS